MAHERCVSGDDGGGGDDDDDDDGYDEALLIDVGSC
jgi:hypothetical protein